MRVAACSHSAVVTALPVCAVSPDKSEPVEGHSNVRCSGAPELTGQMAAAHAMRQGSTEKEGETEVGAVAGHLAQSAREDGKGVRDDRRARKESMLGCGYWQLAGSNNLLQSREDMRALVACLNSKLTGRQDKQNGACWLLA